MPQGGHWIDPHGPECWDITRGESNKPKKKRSTRIRNRVERSHADQEILQYPRHSGRSYESDENTGHYNDETLSENHSKHLHWFSAERHADTDLMRALTGSVRNDTVHSDDREHEPEDSETSS